MTSSDFPLDRQSRAFREASPEDRVPDHRLEEFGEISHSPLASLADIKLPYAYEEENWDADRHPDGPKSLAEAKRVLNARIDDPLAPDGEEVRGAYDDLEEDD